jgi:hypothetical protein
MYERTLPQKSLHEKKIGLLGYICLLPVFFTFTIFNMYGMMTNPSLKA